MISRKFHSFTDFDCFNFQIWLKKHYDQTHNEGKKIKNKCNFCDKRFDYKSMLELHIDKKHPETGEKRYFCEICDKGKKYY